MNEEQRQRAVQQTLAPYLDIDKLRQLVAAGAAADVRAALHEGSAPQVIEDVLVVLADLLRPAQGDQIRAPEELAALLMVEMGHLDHEEFRVVLLDRKNRIQRIHTLYVGSIDSMVVRPGEVFKAAVRRNSASIIIAHNHPSSDPHPSPEDIMLTRQLVDVGAMLSITVLDHLIIGGGRWVSMQQRHLGFP